MQQFKTRKKTAVVIPFTRKDIYTLQKSLKRWKSARYFPCLTPSSSDLVFYFDTILPVNFKQELLQSISTFKFCFKKIVFCNARLHPFENGYPRGSNFQWAYMFLKPNHCIKKNYEYIFYMEPDVTVIRAGWVNEFERLVNNWPVRFWVAGSIYLGKEYLRQPYHINGNAIYAINDNTFIERIVKPVHQWCLQNDYLGYDEGMAYIVHDQITLLYREVLQYFVLIEFIHNNWWTHWNEDNILQNHPLTYLVHGSVKKIDNE